MILFVDDEPRQMDSYIQELTYSGFEVEYKNNVDDALGFLKTKLDLIDLVILDIMMPPGKCIENGEAEYGLRTGVKFYGKIRSLSEKLRVVILTNASDEKIAEKFHNQENCWFFPKEEILPFQLVEEVKSILRSTER